MLPRRTLCTNRKAKSRVHIPKVKQKSVARYGYIAFPLNQVYFTNEPRKPYNSPDRFRLSLVLLPSIRRTFHPAHDSSRNPRGWIGSLVPHENSQNLLTVTLDTPSSASILTVPESLVEESSTLEARWKRAWGPVDRLLQAFPIPIAPLIVGDRGKRKEYCNRSLRQSASWHL